MPRLLLVVVLVIATGCTKIEYPPDSSRSSPSSPTSPSATTTRIEFRVSGNATSVRVRFSNAQDGLTQVITTLPYITQLTTKETAMFVSLEATPLNYSAQTLYPFMSVQIVVNGALFREATSNEFLLNTLAVNGTWRQ